MEGTRSPGWRSYLQWGAARRPGGGGGGGWGDGGGLGTPDCCVHKAMDVGLAQTSMQD